MNHTPSEPSRADDADFSYTITSASSDESWRAEKEKVIRDIRRQEHLIEASLSRWPKKKLPYEVPPRHDASAKWDKTPMDIKFEILSNVSFSLHQIHILWKIDPATRSLIDTHERSLSASIARNQFRLLSIAFPPNYWIRHPESKAHLELKLGQRVAGCFWRRDVSQSYRWVASLEFRSGMLLRLIKCNWPDIRLALDQYHAESKSSITPVGHIHDPPYPRYFYQAPGEAWAALLPSPIKNLQSLHQIGGIHLLRLSDLPHTLARRAYLRTRPLLPLALMWMVLTRATPKTLYKTTLIQRCDLRCARYAIDMRFGPEAVSDFSTSQQLKETMLVAISQDEESSFSPTDFTDGTDQVASHMAGLNWHLLQCFEKRAGCHRAQSVNVLWKIISQAMHRELTVQEMEKLITETVEDWRPSRGWEAPVGKEDAEKARETMNAKFLEPVEDFHQLLYEDWPMT